MQTISISLSSLQSTDHPLWTDCVLAIGNFDGVHKGHQTLLATARGLAQKMKLPLAVLTFDPHPRDVLQGRTAQPRLTPRDEKRVLLEELGVDLCGVMTFDEALSRLSAVEFFQQVLRHACQGQAIVVGENFTFGHGREGDAASLAIMAQEFGIPVIIQDLLVDEAGKQISSRRIIDCLKTGQLTEANHFLGRDHQVNGVVVRGDQRGRTIGFPTANVHCPDFVLPAHGVYAVHCSWGNRLLQGVANLGIRPTFGLTREVLEAHLFDFDQDIYDEVLHVSFRSFLRPEQKFASVQDLIKQIGEDSQRARQLLIL